jgi:tyrosine-protein kinase Etk/Wzc
MWELLWARRRMVLRVAWLVIAGVVAFTLLTGIRFESVGQLYLGEITMAPVGVQQTPSGGFGLNEPVQGLVASEIEILQSVSLVRRAVLESGVNVTIVPHKSSELSYFGWLLHRQDPRSADAVLDVVHAVNTDLGHNGTVPMTVAVRFIGPTEYEVCDPVTLAVLGHGKVGAKADLPGLTLNLVAGPEGPPAAGAIYDVTVAPLDKVITKTLSRLKITVPKQAAIAGDINVVTLAYTNSSPQRAASFLRNLMSAYLDTRQSWKTQDAAAAEAFVTRQIEGVRQSLDELQKKLADYRQDNQLVVLDDETKALVEEIGKYEELRATTRMEAAGFADLKRVTQGKNPPVGALMLADQNDPVLAKMAESLSDDRQKLADLETRYNDTSPELRRQRILVDEQVQNIRSYVESRARRAQESLGALDAIIGQFNDKLKMMPAAQLGLAQLTRESGVYSKMYSYLLERQQEAAIFKASTLSKNHVLYEPEPAIRVETPSLLLRALCIPVGLLLGAGFVLARAVFGRTFESVADVRRSVVGVPVLATIPRAPSRKRKRRKAGEDTPGTFDVTAHAPQSAYAEAFRSLRATLLAWRARAGCGVVVLVTSPSRGDGKTSFALSLASALSASQKGVLVIDADLRAPDGAAGATEESPVGLRDVLRGAGHWSTFLDCVNLTHTAYSLLPRGGPDVPEVLTSDRMAQLVAEARAGFDFVLIDSPSFPAASDALVLAQLADVTLSLVRPGGTPRALTEEHLRELVAHTTDLAVVVNDDAQGRPGKRRKGPRGPRAPKKPVDDRRTGRDPVASSPSWGAPLVPASNRGRAGES